MPHHSRRRRQPSGRICQAELTFLPGLRDSATRELYERIPAVRAHPTPGRSDAVGVTLLDTNTTLADAIATHTGLTHRTGDGHCQLRVRPTPGEAGCSASCAAQEPSSSDVILACPPWGDKVGRGQDLQRLHDRLVDRAADLCRPHTRLVVITQQIRVMDTALAARADTWTLIDEQRVWVKGHHPRIYTLAAAAHPAKPR